MTAPLSLPPSCVLYVDGVRYNDGQIGENPLDPVALDDLKVVWGRPNSLDQPAPSTLTFTVLDQTGGQRFLDKLHIGAKVDVNAEAIIYPDPTVSTIPALLPGPSAGLSFTGSAAVCTAKTVPGYGSRMAWVNFPPAGYSSNPSAWDAIPRALAGQSWRLKVSVIFPGTLAGWRGYAAEIQPIAFVNPSGVGAYTLPDQVTVTPANTAGDLMFVPPAGVWLGFQVRIYPTGPNWQDLNSTTSWTGIGDARSWDQLATFSIQNVAMLAPAAGALRAGAVISGRVTDLTAQYDEGKGATLIDVIVQSHLAELGNRYVGDIPWAVEGLASRFAKIVTASGQAINYTIDPTVADVPISYMDVDNQPAASLLDELAKSVGGALWSAASLTTGPYLWLEDIDQRPGMYTLQADAGGIVHIVLRSTISSGKIINIDACDVLLDPVQWAQTTEDNSTRVVVTWQLQGVDDKGLPKVTATDETAVDNAREAATGQRRIQVTTQLSQQANALHVANSMLGRVVTPGWRISGLTLDLAHEQLDARMLNNVMQILDGSTRLGLGILLSNLPPWSPIAPGVTEVGLFLEGGRFTNSDGAWSLELLTSSADAQGKADVPWNQLPADWLWNEFDPAIAWNDLAGVTYP